MEQAPDNIESGIGSGIGNNTLVVPENKIILLAVGLAFLETAATWLAYSAFVWSTVVVLGGFATTLETIDFWFVTILSLIEGTRIFRQKGELEWRSNAQSKVQSVPPTGKPSIVAIVVAIVSWVLFLLQFVSVITCVFLSLYRLVRQYYGAVLDSSTKNRKYALNIFYGLSLADSVLYVLQNTCLYFSKNCLIPKVSKEYNLNPSEFHIHLYFYDIYSRCINRSFLEGLKMNFLSYNMELLLSSGDDEQLRGVQGLSALAKKDGFSVETLDAIGAVQEVLERLIEMLQCPHQMYIRIEAARIISSMVSINDHLSKVIAIPRLMESIVSLLYDSKEIEIQYMGLKILESLVNDQENWANMGSSRDLLPKLIRMTELNPKRVQMQMIAELAVKLTVKLAVKLAVKLTVEIETMSGGPSELLNCSEYQKQEIRRDAAKNIFNMVQKSSILNELRDFTQFIEFIGSLLYDNDSIDSQHADSYDYSRSSLLGLQILKILVEHCFKIEDIIKNLLTKIIGMTKLNSNASAIQTETAKLALELVKMLVQTDPSLTLTEMNKMTFGISNLVSVLQYPERSLHDLQILAIETLKSLVNPGHQHSIKISVSRANQEALGNLFSVLLMVGIYNNEEIAIKAGETLDFLSRESKDNCQLMMSTKLGHEQSLILSLISVLDDLSRGIFVARILRNICAYAEADCVYINTDLVEWIDICAVAPQVVKFVMEQKDELQEAAIGIAARIFKFIDKSDFDRIFEESSGVTTLSLISVLLEVFRRHPSVSNEVPIRRLSIDLLSTVIEIDKVAILSRMSKEVRVVLRRKLKEGSIQSDVFSFLREPAAVEYFTDS